MNKNIYDNPIFHVWFNEIICLILMVDVGDSKSSYIDAKPLPGILLFLEELGAYIIENNLEFVVPKVYHEDFEHHLSFEWEAKDSHISIEFADGLISYNINISHTYQYGTIQLADQQRLLSLISIITNTQKHEKGQ